MCGFSFHGQLFPSSATNYIVREHAWRIWTGKDRERQNASEESIFPGFSRPRILYVFLCSPTLCGAKEMKLRLRQFLFLGLHKCGRMPAAQTRRKSLRVPRAIHSLKSRTLTATVAPRNVWRCPGQRMNVLEVGQRLAQPRNFVPAFHAPLASTSSSISSSFFSFSWSGLNDVHTKCTPCVVRT